MNYIGYIVGFYIFLVGVYGIVRSKNFVHLILCLTVLQSSTYVILLQAGFRTHRVPPIWVNVPPGTPAVDPVMQALMLTDIVVEATVAALLLAIAMQLHKAACTLDPDELDALEG